MGDSRTSRSGNILVGVLILHTHKRLRRTVARMNTRSGNMLVGVLILHTHNRLRRTVTRMNTKLQPQVRALCSTQKNRALAVKKLKGARNPSDQGLYSRSGNILVAVLIVHTHTRLRRTLAWLHNNLQPQGRALCSTQKKRVWAVKKLKGARCRW